MIVMPYCPPNWFSALGAWKAARELDKKGWPEMKNWRFITLTLAPELFPDAEEAFECGNRRFREMLAYIRKHYGLSKQELKFFKKLEFTRRGWAHWHVALNIKHKVPADLLRKWWGLGRVEVKRMYSDDMTYLTKYVSKASDLPEWALQRRRLRIWSASRGFWTHPARAVPPASEMETKKVVKKPPEFADTIRERIKKWAGCVLLNLGERADGKPVVRREMLAEGATFSDVVRLTIQDIIASGKRGHVRSIYDVSPWRVSLPEAALKRWDIIYQPTV